MTPFDMETINEASHALERGDIAEAKLMLDGLLGSVDHSHSERAYKAVRGGASPTNYSNKAVRIYKHLGHVKQFIRSWSSSEFQVFEGETVWRALPQSQVDAMRPTKS